MLDRLKEKSLETSRFCTVEISRRYIIEISRAARVFLRLLTSIAWQVRRNAGPFDGKKENTPSPWLTRIRFTRILLFSKSSQKLPEPPSQSQQHLHFALIRLCLALLFIISISKAPRT